MIFRAAAVLLLMLAAADLAFPLSCRENASRLAAAPVAASLEVQQDDSGSRTSDRQQEDCFVWCTHVVSAQPQTLLTSLPRKEPPAVARHLGEPAVPVLSFFRPPRLA